MLFNHSGGIRVLNILVNLPQAPVRVADEVVRRIPALDDDEAFAEGIVVVVRV